MFWRGGVIIKWSHRERPFGRERELRSKVVGHARWIDSLMMMGGGAWGGKDEISRMAGWMDAMMM